MSVATVVNQCAATECAYNDNRSCRALAITIGEPSAHTCATYAPKQAKGGRQMTIANVGACKASTCVNNSNLTCTAAQVTMGLEGGQVRCLTFKTA
jgi:hypothetical protein